LPFRNDEIFQCPSFVPTAAAAAVYAASCPTNWPCTGQWITQRLFRGKNWTLSPDLARQMFSAYRHWAPRFEAAALIEAALPHVRDDARDSLAARMIELTTSEAADHLKLTDAARLRRDTLALIRSALKVDDENG
jgi:hypothetical protein